MSKLQFIALLLPGLYFFVLVLIAWMTCNARLSRVEMLLHQNSVNRPADMGRQSFDRHTFMSSQSSDMEAIRDLLRAIHNHLANFSNITARLEGRIDKLPQ